MPSAVSTEKIFANQKIQMFDHDPGATTAIIVSPDGGTTKRTVDGRDAENFAVIAKPTIVGGNGIVKLEIIASASSDMSSPVVVKDSGAVVADSLNDYVALECSMAEVRHLGAGLRYLAGRITMATATDEAAATYIQDGLRFAGEAQTATLIT
jgi:hypothetical protein